MANFFVKGTTAQVDLVKDSAEYANSIIFDTLKLIIYQNGKQYGAGTKELESALSKLKYFKTVSGDTGSAEAPGPDSTLKIAGGTAISTSVGTTGVTIKHEDVSSNVATAGNYVTGVTVNALGHVTAVTKGTLPTNHVVNTRKVQAGEGLTGGGALTADVTISHATTVTEDTTKAINATAGNYVSGIKRDKFGHVAGIAETSLPTLAEGTESGTIKLGDGANVKVKDINTAAYKAEGYFVPTTRKVNNKDLDTDITLTGADIKATGYTKGSNTEIAATDTLNVALGKALGQISALKTATSGLTGALIFKGTVTELPAADSADIANYKVGDVVICNGKEYVLTSGADNTKKWEEFGDQSLIGQLNTKVAALEKKPGLDKTGTVTSVNLTVPTGFAVTGGPVTTTGTLALKFATGYSLPSDTVQLSWTNKVSFPGWASAAPKENGAAAVGTVNKAAREDHVHPLQASVAKLTTARTISTSGDAVGSVSFDGSKDVTINLALLWEELS